MPECLRRAVEDLEMIRFSYDAVWEISLFADMEDSA